MLGGLDQEGMKKIDGSISERLSDYVLESINRLTAHGDDKTKPEPERLIIAGGGVYIGDFAQAVEQKSGITTHVSEPFASIANNVQELYPEYSEISAAFTTCLGLAARALEV